MVTIKINTKSAQQKEDIATLIHAGLRGYKEYVNSNIILNYTDQEEIVLTIGEGVRPSYELGIDTTITVDYHEGENINE